MSSALIVLGGLVFIALSIFFKFMPRLRVVVGLVVGGLITGLVTSRISDWFADGISSVSPPLARWIGQSARSVEVALPSAIAFGLAIVVFVHLRGKGGGGGGKGGGKGGGGGGKSTLQHIALGSALLLPIVADSIGELVRSVA
jgi:hypothetical protein